MPRTLTILQTLIKPEMLIPAFTAILTVGCSTVPEPQYDHLVGTWEGAVHTPAGDLPVAFYISEDLEGLRCMLESPNQSTDQVPCGDIAVNEDRIQIVLPRVGVSYRGILDSDHLSGQWTQAGLNFHLELSRLN